MTYLWVLTSLSCLSAVSAEIRLVDLTHMHGPSTIYWPGNPKYNFTIMFRNITDQGYWYEANSFATAEHGGTHLDSPSHFAKGAWHTAQIPMENLYGPGVVIDVKSKTKNNPDYRVTLQDLMDWERKYGRIPRKSVVVMNSGWSYFYPNKTRVFNSTTPDDPSTFHFPGWHEDAVTWQLNNRHINVLGVDTPSTDYGQSTTFPVHVILGKANIPGMENVAFLDRIPVNGTMIYAAVIKLYDGSGGPIRVFATITEKEPCKTDINNSAMLTYSLLNLILLLSVALLFKKLDILKLH